MVLLLLHAIWFAALYYLFAGRAARAPVELKLASPRGPRSGWCSHWSLATTARWANTWASFWGWPLTRVQTSTGSPCDVATRTRPAGLSCRCCAGRGGMDGRLPRKRAPHRSPPWARGRRARVCDHPELGVDAPSAPACIRERSRALPGCEYLR